MNRVVDILMRRDGLTREEAEAQFREAKSELYDALDGTSCMDPEEVMYEELGLELDYVGDVLWG